MAENAKTIHARHHQVEHHKARRFLADALQGFVPILSNSYLNAHRLDQRGHQRQCIWVIVNNQHVGVRVHLAHTPSLVMCLSVIAIAQAFV